MYIYIDSQYLFNTYHPRLAMDPKHCEPQRAPTDATDARRSVTEPSKPTNGRTGSVRFTGRRYHQSMDG